MAVKQEFIDILAEAASSGNLVVVFGTGISIGLSNNRYKALSWKGLVESGLDYGLESALLTEPQVVKWKDILSSDDMDEILGAAEFVSRKLGAPKGDVYARWLKDSFSGCTISNKPLAAAIRQIRDNGVPICTLNYDSMVEKALSVSGICLSSSHDVMSWMRKETNSVLHLHGRWQEPSTCILGIRDYQSTLDDEVRDLVQRSLGAVKQLLFVGCGSTLSDPNFLSLTTWLRSNIGASGMKHYALVGDGEVAKRKSDPDWRGLVEPIGYGDDHRKLVEALTVIFPKSAKKPLKRNKASRGVVGAEPVGNAEAIAKYKKFLVRDCGQMTVEGLRADMDTAQRKFDLEQLFVPLELERLPPDIPTSDKRRQMKLEKWQGEFGGRLDFGEEFANRPRMALLALPGGGKTLLLKRLAVAYADPLRRPASEDKLPDLDITPVLIRCREWREHIKSPILELINKIPTITGEADIANLAAALTPELQAGKVLLLVDGLDEIHDNGDRETFVENLEKFLETYPSIRLVVTSREAGFALVAPSIARFCDRYRVAPLDEQAIALLCGYWHKLMAGASDDVEAESTDLALFLIKSDSLRRLAENPLLLTMLLVVKHGAGRLPPDRVSLYERAVEILLDTWNIRGHAPLNMKESVPQLSYVALELMKEGKQTATADEIIRLLEAARDTVPQIKRYARDAPDKFLERVELRSSLLVEAGHKKEGIKTVPFYQFRHLTFQEYLAAVAIVEGNHQDYDAGQGLPEPLKGGRLTAEEWKEVVPMAAVLARKQADGILSALVSEGGVLRDCLLAGKPFDDEEVWREGNLPAPIARLTRCLIEEAEATPKTLALIIEQVALFARGCRSDENWRALSTGPYGDELRQKCASLYGPMDWPAASWLRNTYASLCALGAPQGYWFSVAGHDRLIELLSGDQAAMARGLLTICGVFWQDLDREGEAFGPDIVAAVKRCLRSDDQSIMVAAAWAWGLLRRNQVDVQTDGETLDELLRGWIWEAGKRAKAKTSKGEWTTFDFALASSSDLKRESWAPILNGFELQVVNQELKILKDNSEYDLFGGSFVIAYYGKTMSDAYLAEVLDEMRQADARYRVARMDPAVYSVLGVERTSSSFPERPRRKPLKS